MIRGKGPWILIYHEDYTSKEVPYAREREVKNWKSWQRIIREFNIDLSVQALQSGPRWATHAGIGSQFKSVPLSNRPYCSHLNVRVSWGYSVGSGRSSRNRHAGTTSIVPPPASIRSSSFRVTMVPVFRPSSTIVSPKAAVSRFRVCGSARDSHTWTSIRKRPRIGTMKSTSRPVFVL